MCGYFFPFAILLFLSFLKFNFSNIFSHAGMPNNLRPSTTLKHLRMSFLRRCCWLRTHCALSWPQRLPPRPDFDPEHLVAHSSPWSMAKQHYLAALSRRNGLRVKIAQLELACFNFSFGASNHFNIVFRLLPLMVCQLFPSQAERLNAADSLDPQWHWCSWPSSRLEHWVWGFSLKTVFSLFWWLKIAAHPWLQKLPCLDWWLKIAACPWLQKLPFLDWRLCITTTLVQLEYCYPPKSTKTGRLSRGVAYIYIYICICYTTYNIYNMYNINNIYDTTCLTYIAYETWYNWYNHRWTPGWKLSPSWGRFGCLCWCLLWGGLDVSWWRPQFVGAWPEPGQSKQKCYGQLRLVVFNYVFTLLIFYIFIYLYIFTYIHTYIHTQTYIHTYTYT